jgi:hypothetical protein
VNEEMRRAVAYSAAARINGKASSAIYSYEAGRYTSMGGSGNNIYDYEAGAHIADSGSGFFHYGQSAHVDLRTSGTSFNGYDFSTACHFTGSINGNAVQLYDYGAGRYFNYSV